MPFVLKVNASWALIFLSSLFFEFKGGFAICYFSHVFSFRCNPNVLTYLNVSKIIPLDTVHIAFLAPLFAS